MNSKKQNKLIMFALLMAVIGMGMYFMGKDVVQVAGLMLVSLSFVVYGADALIKYRMTKKVMFLGMSAFFYLLVIVGMYMTLTLMK